MSNRRRVAGVVALAGLALWLMAGACAQSRAGRVTVLTLSEALETTLQLHPAFKLAEQQVALANGLRRAAAGTFDTLIGGAFSQDRTVTPLTSFEQQQYSALGVTATNQATNLTTFSAQASKEFRNGVSLGPTFEDTRTTDNVQDQTGTNLTNLVFGVNIPLMRGHGRRAVAAQETAAGIEAGASGLDLNQAASDMLEVTAENYWALVAAERDLAVARGSEQRGTVYVQNVQTLIQADRVPKYEIYEVQANQAQRTLERIQAEQIVTEARQALALAMGLAPARMMNVGNPADDFPTPLAPLRIHAGDVRAAFQLAIAHRADILAAERRVSEAEALLAGAHNQTRPQLNLNFNTGYSGLSEGTGATHFFAAPFKDLQGPDAFAGVTYSFPPRNNAAQGALEQSQATVEEARLRLEEVQRRVMAEATDAVEAVARASREVAEAKEAVNAYQQALEGEREKYRLGVGSLVDVLTIEDRLTAALQAQVAAAEAYAIAIAQLRHATGTIVPRRGAIRGVDASVFLKGPRTIK